MGTSASKDRAKKSKGKGGKIEEKKAEQNSPVVGQDKSPLVDQKQAGDKERASRLRRSKQIMERRIANETKKKITRQLSCAPINRATAQRTRAAERFASRDKLMGASGATRGGEDDNDEKAEAHALAQHLINISPFNKRWAVEETISEGTYGVVFSVVDIQTKTKGVIKVAKAMGGEVGNQTAEWEAFVLEKIFRANPQASIVRLLDKGMLVDQNNDGMEFMVLEKVEAGVAAFIYEETGSARRVRVCNVALQMLKGIHDLHAQGLLHRDLKSDNMGICSRENPVVLLFDLGLARMYTDADGLVRPPRTVVHFRGTPEWASGHAAKSREQTRFDDVIAWFYVIVEFFDPSPDSKQPLPWSFCRNNAAVSYLKSIYCPARLLLRYCPSQFYAINTYLQSANRYKAPDYAWIADRLLEAIEECKNEKDFSKTAIGAIESVPQP